ncbi:MAG: DUF222 domain-containing protein [Pseudonocardiaceae bacterium]|nr:DUF222 domain-containing protein [Pseudonocardiaceae bacterium]
MTAATGPVVSDAEVVDELRAAWAEVSRGYARCWAAMAEVAGRSPGGWESAEIAAALTFTTRRADYELGCAQALVDRLPRVYAALAAGELDHHKARVFTSYLADVTAAQAERICARLVQAAVGWTTGQLAARLLREVAAIDPDYTRRTYQRAVRERSVHGYLDHTGTAVLTGSGLPAGEAGAAAARLEELADAARAAGYPATVGQTRADLYLRLLDGTLDGQDRQQILTTMVRLGPICPADADPADERSKQQRSKRPGQGEGNHESPQREAPDRPAPEPPAQQPERPQLPERAGPGGQPGPVAAIPPSGTGVNRPVRYGIEVRIGLSTLLGLDEHPAELAGWGPIPAPAARDLVAAQHAAEWRLAIVDTDGYLLHGDLTRRRPRLEPRGGRGDCVGGIVEIAVAASMLDRLAALVTDYPDWARLLHGIAGIWQYRQAARAALDSHPHRRFAHAALRRHIQMRDRHCVGVGCRRRAAAAELDHTRDHACGGHTVTTNSGPGCAYHHTMKHWGGWTLEQPEPGHFVWTSPLRQTYRTRGEAITPDLPEPIPRDLHPDPPGVPTMCEGPILHQPQPAPLARPARPPPAEPPDEPPF